MTYFLLIIGGYIYMKVEQHRRGKLVPQTSGISTLHNVSIL